MDKLKQELIRFKDSESFPHILGGVFGLLLSILFGGLITAEADTVAVEPEEADNGEISVESKE